jgi:tetratricopeptide (TPR) repeat protein
LRKAVALSPRDANVLSGLVRLDVQRGMFAPALERVDALLALPLSQQHERQAQEGARQMRPELVAKLGAAPSSLKWANLSELHHLLNELYGHGRVDVAVELLESAYPPDGRPWEVWDRIATIRLHLGEPGRAAALWSEAKAPPSDALRQARLGAARLADGDFDGARAAYISAIEANPKLFEALYGMAVLEADAGRAAEAWMAAWAADEVAPHDAAKTAVASLMQGVGVVLPSDIVGPGTVPMRYPTRGDALRSFLKEGHARQAPGRP